MESEAISFQRGRDFPGEREERSANTAAIPRRRQIFTVFFSSLLLLPLFVLFSFQSASQNSSALRSTATASAAFPTSSFSTFLVPARHRNFFSILILPHFYYSSSSLRSLVTELHCPQTTWPCPLSIIRQPSTALHPAGKSLARHFNPSTRCFYRYKITLHAREFSRARRIGDEKLLMLVKYFPRYIVLGRINEWKPNRFVTLYTVL